MSYWDERYSRPRPAQWSYNGAIISAEVGTMIKPCKLVFDFGCGDGSRHDFIKQFGQEYIGYDPSCVAIEQAKARYPTSNFVSEWKGITNIDLIHCNFVLQHILDDDELLEILKSFRVMLARSGSLLVVDNISHKDNLGYMIFRSEGEHEALFTMACFEIAESKDIKIDGEDVKIWRLV